MSEIQQLKNDIAQKEILLKQEKVRLKEINPAYTSRIAKDKYMKSMGCSVHMAASYVITRRGCGYIDII